MTLAVPWRSSTWLSSCAITPTTSPSPAAASNIPAIDEHRPAGQRECVDVLQVHRREGVLEHRIVQLGGSHVDEPLAEPVEVARKCGVGDDGVLLANLCRGLAAEFDVLFWRVLVFRSRDSGLRAGERHRNRDAVESRNNLGREKFENVTRVPILLVRPEPAIRVTRDWPTTRRFWDVMPVQASIRSVVPARRARSSAPLREVPAPAHLGQRCGPGSGRVASD